MTDRRMSNYQVYCAGSAIYLAKLIKP